MKKQPLHITQAFGVEAKENELDFFDANLKYDSLLFVDPFLLKSSPNVREKKLYKRFTEYFKIALIKSISAKTDYRSSTDLLRFLSFPEPKEINLGYTKSSNEGRGLRGNFARALHAFFISETAKRVLTKERLEEGIDPEFFILFADKVAEDGISDLTANLIMDYLVEYTQDQCKKWGIKTKSLKVNQTFDYDETQDWTSGMFFELPENPLRPEEPVVFVPKRLLRSSDLTKADIKSKIKGILKEDPILKERFSRILYKHISEIDIKEIREILLQDERALKQFINFLKKRKKEPYDFIRDPLEFLAYKRFLQIFEKRKVIIREPSSCKDLLTHVKSLIKEFKRQYERKDYWKDAWYKDRKGLPRPIRERAWGRAFRAAGDVYFLNYPSITFDSEVESGRGPVDFRVIFKECKITIEIKLLKNSASTGSQSIPAYLHGIKEQLPGYTINLEATYAFYITGQHYREIGVKRPKNHDYRANKIRAEMPKTTKKIKKEKQDFKELFYINIDLTPKPSFSKK